MKTLRISFLLLIFANILLFAWWQGYLAPWGPSTLREPQRLAAQVTPEKLKLLPKEVAGAKDVDPNKAACQWVDGIKEGDMKALLATPQAFTGLELTSVDAEITTGYEVSIPALASQTAAQAKQAEVKALGIEAPSAIAAEANGGFRLVLARASDQAVAEAQLLKLKEKGIKSAHVQPLPPVKAARLQVVGTSAAFAALAAKLTELPDVRVHGCTEP